MTRSMPLLLAALLAGCAVGPDYERPATDLPAELGRPAGETEGIDAWWTKFGDPRLTGYVEDSFAHNNDLKIALANVDAAAALLRLNRDDYFPDIDGAVHAARRQASGNSPVPQPSAPVTEYSAGLVVNYELDVWGRIRRANEAALADLATDTEVLHGVHSALAADVARTYFQALALRRQIELLADVHSTRIDNQQLQKIRLDGGLISPYDYEQARSETAAVAAQLPELRSRLRQTVTALAVLRGESPRELFEAWSRPPSASPTPLPAAPPVPMDLPSGILERRPDIRAAEQRLVAANARIGVAMADYFPRVSLTGFAGSVSSSFSSLFDGGSEAWEAIAAGSVPLTSLRTADANVDGAKARRDAAAAAYAGTVQRAFQETLDALTRVDANRAILIAQNERVDALANARRVATARYEAGRIGYFEVLDIERQVRQVEQDQVSARLGVMKATVDLFRALGGGWSPVAGAGEG